MNLIYDINSASTSEAVKQIILKFLAKYDLKDFGYAIQVPTINKVEPPYIVSAYDPVWLDHYIGNEYYKVDTTVLYSHKNILPVHWEDIKLKSENDKFISESKDAGLLNGVAYPIHGSYGEKGLFCIAGKEKINDYLFMYMNMLIPYLHNKMIEIDLKNHTHFNIPKLTLRETEFLKWLAVGKTMEEISIIMSISYRTCIDYNEKLKRKFKCSSKNQVIALAIIKQVITI